MLHLHTHAYIHECNNPSVYNRDVQSLPWRAECIPTYPYTCWFHSLVPSSLIEGVFISKISWCSDWLEWKPAYSLPSMAHDWTPLVYMLYHYFMRIREGEMQPEELSVCIWRWSTSLPFWCPQEGHSPVVGTEQTAVVNEKCRCHGWVGGGGGGDLVGHRLSKVFLRLPDPLRFWSSPLLFLLFQKVYYGQPFVWPLFLTVLLSFWLLSFVFCHNGFLDFNCHNSGPRVDNGQ